MLKRIKDYLITLLGIIVLGIGLFLIITYVDPHGIILPFQYVCIGIGSGLFSIGISNIISSNTIKKHPEMQKQIDIQKNDERNIAISSKAKAKAYDIMIYVYAVLMFAYTLMQVSAAVVLLLVASYIFIIIIRIYYHSKYDKEM